MLEDTDLLTYFSFLSGGSKKPSSKANQAAKAALKGVCFSPTFAPKEAWNHQLTIFLSTGERPEGPQDPQVDHVPQTEDARSLAIAEIPSQVDPACDPAGPPQGDHPPAEHGKRHEED